MSQDQGVAMDFLGVEKGFAKNESQTDQNLVTPHAKQEPFATEQMRSLVASSPFEGNTMNFSQDFILFSKHFNEKGNENAAIGRGEYVYLGNGKEDVKGSKPVNEENVSTQLGLFSLLSSPLHKFSTTCFRDKTGEPATNAKKNSNSGRVQRE